MMGETFVGNPLSSLTYPLNILFLVMPVNLAVIIYQLLHFLIASISVYYLAKTLKFSNLASFSAAIFYTFSIKFLFHLSAGHVTMLAAYSFFPLAFLSVRLALLKKNIKFLILGAVSLALMYITYPTIFFYSVIFVAAYGFYFFLKSLLEKRLSSKIAIYFLLKLSLIILLAMMLCSATLIPNMEFSPFSTRSILRIEDVAIPLWNLKKFLMSLLFPYPILNELDQESILFIGFIPIILALIGFFFLTRFQKLVFALGMLILGLFIAGTSTPVFKLAYEYIPFLNYSRVTTRPFFIVILIGSLLSASALQRIKNRKAVFLLIGVFLFESLLLFTLKLKSIPSLDFSETQIYDLLGSDKSLFRVYCTTHCFNPQQLNKYGIQMLGGETPIQDKKFVDFLGEVGGYSYSRFAVIFPPYQVWQVQNPPQPDPILLGKANVKYVASTYQLASGDFSYIGYFNKIYLYYNKKYKQRFIFINDQDVKNIYYSPNKIFTTFEPQPFERELLFSENYYPGWKAFSQNSQLRVLKKDNIFRSVMVPAFAKEVELKYQPESFQAGRAISIGTLFFLLLLLFRKNGQKN